MTEVESREAEAGAEGGIEPIGEAQLRGRVIYSLLRPAVRLARAFQVRLEDIRKWVELAYFHELRREGFTLQEVAERLDVSERKASELSRKLKTNFFAPEREYGLPRRIEFLVWAEPMSKAKLVQHLEEVTVAEVEEALERLLEEGRVVADKEGSTTYLLARGASRLVEDSWVAKIDGLNKLMQTLADAVYARFFDDEPKAFARNLQFHLRAEALPKLREMYENCVWEELVELDEAAETDPNALGMEVSVLWSPIDFVKDKLAAMEKR